MLRNCACFQRQRRGSSFEDSSSCRSSEIERGSEVSTNNGSILKLITSRGWCRQWRKTGSTISMSKIERSKHFDEFIFFLDLFILSIAPYFTRETINVWKDIGCYEYKWLVNRTAVYRIRYEWLFISEIALSWIRIFSLTICIFIASFGSICIVKLHLNLKNFAFVCSIIILSVFCRMFIKISVRSVRLFSLQFLYLKIIFFKAQIAVNNMKII